MSLHLSVSPFLSRTAFTLVELIISIALVLIVMLGVNFVFRMTGDTIGSGQILNEQVRNNRGAQAVMFDDFGKMMRDGPFLIIRSRTFAAFRNVADLNSDGLYDTSADSRGQQDRIRSIEGDLPFNTHPLTLNNRNHRQDIVTFFAQGLFRRQTGNDGILVADMTSNESWVYYGHLVLPNNAIEFDLPAPLSGKTNPGYGTPSANPNNFYASTWVLGRVSMLLRQPVNNVIEDRWGNPQVYFSSNPANLSPFAFGTTVNVGTQTFGIQDSRFDLAGTTAAGFRTKLSDFISSNAAGTDWWTRMMIGAPAGARFETNPFVIRPITAASYSQQAPIFLSGATQFVVEFAGDFVRQNRDPNDTSAGGTGSAAGRYGDVQDAFMNPGGTDGEIDFYVDAATRTKRVRWYGLPRDTTGDGRIRAVDGDVVPLYDLIATAVDPAAPIPASAPFERAPFVTSSPQALTTDYAQLTLPNANPTYTCAWGPNDTVRPKMIRVTIVLDDQAGRLAEGQVLEYVFELP